MLDEMYDSAEGFARALDRYAERVGIETETTVRKTVIDFASKVIKDTPHDTGRARASWLLTTDQPGEEVAEEKKHPEYQGNNPPPATDPGRAETGEYWLVNNLEYIEALEDGHSKQAGTGMVANALNAFADHLNNQLDGMETIE
jgi:hypothetical protein